MRKGSDFYDTRLRQCSLSGSAIAWRPWCTRYFGAPCAQIILLRRRVGAPPNPIRSAIPFTQYIGRAFSLWSRYSGWTFLGCVVGLWTAALFPAQVHRLILIGSAPLTDAYVPQIMQRRLANLSSSKANCMANALAMLENGNSQQRQTAIEALPALLAQSDAYQTAPEAVIPGDLWPEDEAAYANLWPLAVSLRTQGALLQSALSVHCPIDIIHGACDPHPAEGVCTPLRKIGVPFTLHLLPRCGHTPFTERYAQDDFYQLMRTLCFA